MAWMISSSLSAVTRTTTPSRRPRPHGRPHPNAFVGNTAATVFVANGLRRFAARSGTDHEAPVRLFAQAVDDHGVFDGVEDVVVRDAVAASRRVNLHTALL